MDSQQTDTSLEERIKDDLTRNFESKRQRLFAKLIGAALGSVPWVGGFLSMAATYKSDESKIKQNQLYEEWFNEHSHKIKQLGETIKSVINRLNEFSEDIDERLDSEGYSQIVRKSFRAWDKADTHEKREMIRKLLTNAGAHKIVDDDLVRLFLDWLDHYHESHFAVIKAIHARPGVTRFQIWRQINGASVAENSMEADLFKYLIRDLSTGGVIRQHRAINYDGSFAKKKPVKKPSTTTMKSAFDDDESYELTSLGQQFVHYAMNEVVAKLK